MTNAESVGGSRYSSSSFFNHNFVKPIGVVEMKLSRWRPRVVPSSIRLKLVSISVVGAQNTWCHSARLKSLNVQYIPNIEQ